MVILWKIPYVDKTKTRTIRTIVDGKPVKRTHFKCCTRELYINTEELSGKDKIFVEIALKAQELLGDISCFICLRDLFKEGDWYSIPNVSDFCTVKGENYFESAEGKQISSNLFMEELLGLPPLIHLRKNLYVPAELSEYEARKWKIPELIPFKKNDFQLSEKQIEILNRFLNDVIALQNSSLCSQYKALSLDVKGKLVSLKQTISKEQYLASLLTFRKLYMNNEPANFKKAVKILQSKQFINHSITEIINAENKAYDEILNEKICENPFYSFLFEDCSDPSIYPNGETLLEVMINVDCIHQGNDKTREKLRAVEQIIPNKKILKFLVWSLILRLKKPIENVARHASNILEFLNAQNIVIPSQSISNAEHKFFQYLFERSTDVAEILWNENNRNTSSISMYRTSALSLIIDRLGINKEKYKIFRGQ